jgi:hypothetical protein
MNRLLERIKAKRTSNLVSTAVILVVIVVDAVFEHSLLALLTDCVATHSGPLSDVLKHMGPWLIEHPYILIVLLFLIVGFNSFVLHGHVKHDEPASAVTAASSASATAGANQTFSANPTAAANPTAIANPTATANPTINQEVHIHNHPEPPLRRRDSTPIPDEPLQPNIVLRGASLIKTDTVQEYFENEALGVPGIIASFHNRSIPGERGVDFDYVRASVTYRNSNDPSVVFTDSPKWLHHRVDDSVSIEHNQSESMVLAVFDPDDNNWVLPFIRPTTFDDGSPGKELHARPLPYGALSVEIALTSDTYIGLPLFNIQFELLGNGKAKLPTVLAATRSAEVPTSHDLAVQGLSRAKVDFVQGNLWIGVDSGLEAVVLRIESRPANVGQAISPVSGLVAIIRFTRMDGDLVHVMSRAYWLKTSENRMSLASGQGAAILIAALSQGKLLAFNNPRKYRPRLRRQPYDGIPPDLPSAHEIEFGSPLEAEVVVVQEDTGITMLRAVLKLTPTDDGCAALLHEKSS